MREYYITVQGRVFETCEGLDKAKERAEEVANLTNQLTWISFKNGKPAVDMVWSWLESQTVEELLTSVDADKLICEDIACKRWTPEIYGTLEYFDRRRQAGIDGRHALGCMHRLPPEEMTSRVFQAYADGLREVVKSFPKKVTIKVKR